MPRKMPSCSWRVLTPTGAVGGVAALQLDGEIDAMLERLGIRPVSAGEVVLRSIPGIDTGLVARWSGDCCFLMPHGGRAVVRLITARLVELGGTEARNDDPARSHPEARDEIEARMLGALARAASPLAIEALLEQPARWARHRKGLGPGWEAEHSARLNRLIDPPLVMMFGPANIGKSTLTNALAGRAVAIVSDIPGTTRDHIGVMIDMAGVVVRFVDTPGLRESPDPQEAEAAAIARQVAGHADLLLLCGDSRGGPPASPVDGRAEMHIAMRADLGTGNWNAEVAVSGLTGQGLGDLVRLIRDRLVPPGDLADPRPWKFWPG